MHSVLKKYVNNKHNLLKFFRKFERLIDDRRYEELKADMRSCHSIPSLSLDVSILKHARTVYTHKVFKLFQVELSKAHDAIMEMVSQSETIYEYKITPYMKKYSHTVTYDTSNGHVSCSCRKFEFAGILCAHVLKVLNAHHILKIPEMYISKRWTKYAKRGLVEDNFELVRTPVTPGKNKEAEEKIRIGERYRELCRVFNQLVTRAALIEETFVFVKDNCCKNIEEVDIMLGKGMASLNLDPTPHILVPNVAEKQASENEDLEVLEPSNEVEDRTITDFHGTSIRGLKTKKGLKDKSGKRIKGALEQALSKKRKPKIPGKLSFDNAIADDVHNVSPVEEGGVQPSLSKKKPNKKNNSSVQLSHDNQAASYPPMPQISPYYQNYRVGPPDWNLSHPSLSTPYYRSGLSPMQPPGGLLQMGQLGPNVGQQFMYNPQQEERDRANPSMMALLQAQIVGTQSSEILFNNGRNEVPDHAKDHAKE